MKKKFIYIVLSLVVVFAAASLASCNNCSPKRVAKSFVTDYKAMNADGLASHYDFKDRETGKAYAELLKKSFDEMTEEQRAQVKSVSFRNYKKTEGSGNAEKGDVTVSYQKDGKGDKLETVMTFSFVKSGKKWYIKDDYSDTVTEEKSELKSKKSALGKLDPGRDWRGAEYKEGFKDDLRDFGGDVKNFGEDVRDFGSDVGKRVKGFFRK